METLEVILESFGGLLGASPNGFLTALVSAKVFGLMFLVSWPAIVLTTTTVVGG